MIRKFFYALPIAFALIWLALTKVDLGFDPAALINLSPFMPEALRNITVPPMVLSGLGWFCSALTAIFYIVGIVNIYRHAGTDLWRAILYSIALLVLGVGALFFEMHLKGVIDRSSLYLIGVMVLPFVPAALFIPLTTTFRDYLAPRAKS